MSTVRSAGNVSGSLKTGFFLTEKGTRMFVVLGIFSVLGSVTKVESENRSLFISKLCVLFLEGLCCSCR